MKIGKSVMITDIPFFTSIVVEPHLIVLHSDEEVPYALSREAAEELNLALTKAVYLQREMNGELPSSVSLAGVRNV